MATLSVNIVISGPASTAVRLLPIAPFSGSGGALTAPGPVAAGTPVATVAVDPPGWQGARALTGANAASFTLADATLMTAAVLAAGTFSFDITATP